MDNELKFILVKRINSEEGENVALSDLRTEEYDLRVPYKGKEGYYLWRELFPDQMPDALSSYIDNIEKIFVCPSNRRRLGGIL